MDKLNVINGPGSFELTTKITKWAIASSESVKLISDYSITLLNISAIIIDYWSFKLYLIWIKLISLIRLECFLKIYILWAKL